VDDVDEAPLFVTRRGVGYMLAVPAESPPPTRRPSRGARR
jgi:hypothetical protein